MPDFQIARDDRKREEDAKEAAGKSKGKKAAGGKSLIFIKLFFIKLHLQSDQCSSEKTSYRQGNADKGKGFSAMSSKFKAKQEEYLTITLHCFPGNIHLISKL